MERPNKARTSKLLKDMHNNVVDECCNVYKLILSRPYGA